MPKTTHQDRFVREPELLSRYGVSATTIWRWEKAGRFPRRVQLGPNCNGWLESELDAWDAEKVQARDSAVA
jgi:prophage regulatory protein